ncbi:polyamine ABC transporter ATP-binding protein [Roseospirillum parvum]
MGPPKATDTESPGATRKETRTAAAKGTPLIRLENVTKKFGDFVAVDNISLEIGTGELFALLGASGCGKSTLLRMLAGFETPTSGRIVIDGVDMSRVPPYHRPVNMMFQSYALFPHMSVAGNVAYGLRQEGMGRAEIAERVEQMLDLVELSDFARRRPAQLSGGQRQRVALARCLAKRPKVLLLDEPLAALDKKLRERTQLELANIQESLGITFIVVTHDQEEAMTMADRVAVMNGGRILQVDNPHTLYEYPMSRYVAGFFGTVNLFEGVLIEDEPDHITIRSDEYGADITVGHGISGAEGNTMWVAVRPEKVVLSKEPPPAGQANAQRGVIEEIVYLGGISTYLVRLAGSGRLVRVTTPNLTRAVQGNLTWEDEVHLWFDPASAVVLSQ